LKGIIPRVMESIFEMIVQASEDNEYQIKVSMVEIYNEKVNDLLDSNTKIITRF
jgi:kinesin family protein 5